MKLPADVSLKAMLTFHQSQGKELSVHNHKNSEADAILLD